MKTYVVEIVIENKPTARDPEGETICRDLIHKQGYVAVESVRAGKFLRIKLSAESEEEAKKKTFEMCNELRIYNPVVHTCKIEVEGVET